MLEGIQGREPAWRHKLYRMMLETGRRLVVVGGAEMFRGDQKFARSTRPYASKDSQPIEPNGFRKKVVRSPSAAA